MKWFLYLNNIVIVILCKVIFKFFMNLKKDVRYENIGNFNNFDKEMYWKYCYCIDEK